MIKNSKLLFGAIIILLLILSSCSTVQSDVLRGTGGNSDLLLNNIIKQYNADNNASVKGEDIELLASMALDDGYLVLCSHKKLNEKEIVLLDIRSEGRKWKVAREAHGEYSIDCPGVSSIELEDRMIYFGNIPINSYDKYNSINVEFDDGNVVNEALKDNSKGYILTSKLKSSVVNFSFVTSSGKVENFIKDFINYGSGIFECTWSQPQ